MFVHICIATVITAFGLCWIWSDRFQWAIKDAPYAVADAVWYAVWFIRNLKTESPEAK